MNKSFTLIEILVVIVVIGVLSAFILVGMSSITSSANIAKGKAFVNSLDNALLLARVSQWKLDQKDGAGPFTTPDAWGTNTGTLMDVDNACVFTGTVKCPQLVTSGCPSNNCMSFDGANDYVDIGSAAVHNLNKGTFEIWANLDTLGVAGNLFYLLGAPTQAGDEAGLRVSNTGGVWGTPNNGQWAFSTAAEPININKWYHYVMTWDGTNARLYINSNLKQTIVFSFNSSTGDRSNYLGKSWDGNPWDGLIDDVRVYNAAIPTSEIQQNYFVGISKLFKNNGIALNEFNQRLAELKSNTVEHE